MTEETLEAAVLLLRARAMESYGIIKDMYARPTQEGDVELLAQKALHMASAEGAMITLQQYKADIIEAANKKRAADLAMAAAELEPDPAESIRHQDIVTAQNVAAQVREVDES
jgi:hypothetical protein